MAVRARLLHVNVQLNRVHNVNHRASKPHRYAQLDAGLSQQ